MVLPLKLTGTLNYSPKLLGDRISSKWWLTIKCDTGLAKYWRHLYHLHTHRCYRLDPPSWREHVTIIRDEEPAELYRARWEKWAGHEIEFEVIPKVEHNNEYYWLPVICEEAMLIRKELGLAEPYYPFHFSIGHVPYPTGV
jgi:hypothetical protein